MNQTFLTNERIHLRAVEPEDLEVMYQIENAPEMWNISSFIEPYSRYALRDYILSCQQDLFADKQLRLMVVIHESHEVVGTIDLDHFDPHHLRAGVGLALLESARRQGIAFEALELLAEYAFRFLHLHQLYAYIPVDNTASLRLFQKAGFQQSAVLKHWIRTPEGYKDVTLWQKITPF